MEPMKQLELLPLLDDVISITGTLSVPRKEVLDTAMRLGARTTNYVSKKTTILIVGHDAVSKITHEPSRKYCKALELIKNGKSLEIIEGEEFLLRYG